MCVCVCQYCECVFVCANIVSVCLCVCANRCGSVIPPCTRVKIIFSQTSPHFTKIIIIIVICRLNHHHVAENPTHDFSSLHILFFYFCSRRGKEMGSPCGRVKVVPKLPSSGMVMESLF